ncbi:MAG: DeoR/GlpR family DNA-binding transcription regulator [Lacrimispora sp.]|uniref:DeoR/GlpR family DNA-binding transcription regulator n=1 Tax=Lacrimispora sp. TaxID=2719234 RepID=UPI0039E6A85E
MAAKDRLIAIKEKLRAENKVVVSELSNQFQVTEETIRRDLDKLESEGVLTRTFGGAVLNHGTHGEGIHFYRRAAIHLTEKKKMAKAFADILATKFTIAADASSTVMEALKLLPDSSDVTVLTTSTEVFRGLAHTNINVISTGGIYNKNSLSLRGQIAMDNIRKYHVDILLISCKGVDLEMGVTDSNEGEAIIKKVMVEQASEVALFADHFKMNKTAFTHFLDLSQIDYLITDQKPDEEWIRFCEENHIQLVY